MQSEQTLTNELSTAPVDGGFTRRLLARVKGDKVIWSVVVLLSVISLLAVFSATRSLAYKHDKHSTHYLFNQLVILGMGLGIMYFIHRINYKKFDKLSVLLFGLSIVLLIATYFIGANINGGQRWIKLPGIGITFQSSDLAKLALFMFLARVLSIKQGAIKDLRKGFVPVLVPVFVTCALIAPANLSTALMLGATCCILFFIGRVQVKHILMLMGAGIIGVALLFSISIATGMGRGETWKKRLADFGGSADSTTGKKEDVYQVLQAKIAIANGGMFGRGPGNSLQRDYLPEAFSDFIFATIIEEYGLFGGGVLMFLYLTFLWRSILIFRRCPYAFGAFLAVGLSITLVFQSMLNMGVAVHLLPVTGLTLPLVSMGGSSILFTSVAIGIVLSVSRYVDEMEGRQAAAVIANTDAENGEDPGDGNETEAPVAPTPIPAKQPKKKPEPELV